MAGLKLIFMFITLILVLVKLSNSNKDSIVNLFEAIGVIGIMFLAYVFCYVFTI